MKKLRIIEAFTLFHFLTFVQRPISGFLLGAVIIVIILSFRYSSKNKNEGERTPNNKMFQQTAIICAGLYLISIEENHERVSCFN